MKESIIKYTLFVLVVSAVCTLLFDAVDFVDNPISGAMGMAEIVAYCMVIFVANVFFVSALASYRWLFAITFPVYSLLGATLAYFRISSSAVLTPMLIDVTLHHDVHEGMELITWQLVLLLLFAILLTSCAVWYRFKKIKISYKWAWAACLTSFVVMLCYINCNYRVRSGCINRYPYSVYKAMVEYIDGYHGTVKRVNPFSIDAKTKPVTPNTATTVSDTIQADIKDSLTIVLVLGESLRANHLGLNGYERNTSPNLSRQTNLVSFPNIYSEYTHTNRSLPHILTRADSVNTERAFTETSFVPKFASQGFKTIWLSNQELAHTYADFINECDTAVYVHPEKSPFVYSPFYDVDMLPYLYRRLEENNQRDLIIFHTIGSHWYYNLHVPDSLVRFTPVTDNRNVKFNTLSQIINSYDNTIVATDSFLSQVISSLQNRNAILIFLSDHGEALGEDGVFLHANDAESIKHPAMFVWMSEKYKNTNPVRFGKMLNNSKKHYRTDFLFPSILDAANIETAVADTTISIFR